MTDIYHLNCGTLLVPGYPTVVCHCLLLSDPQGLALVDTGIGMLDVQHPGERLGQPLIDAVGFQFHAEDTALRRLESLGLAASDVRHIVLTHGDPDHVGGLADFPTAVVHLAEEELAAVSAGGERYVPNQFSHAPHWQPIGAGQREWFGLPARPVDLGIAAEVLLIPLFGHTLGHCGVAVRAGHRWLLHAGDAYYLRAELDEEQHPVSALAAARAESDPLRRASLDQLRRLRRDHGDEIDMVCYHDLSEFGNFPLGRH